MSIRSVRTSLTTSRLGSGLWPRWLLYLHSVLVPTRASVISDKPSFRRRSVAMNASRTGATPGAVVGGSHSGDRGEGRDHPSRPSLPGDRRTTAAPQRQLGEVKESGHGDPRRGGKPTQPTKF